MARMASTVKKITALLLTDRYLRAIVGYVGSWDSS